MSEKLVAAKTYIEDYVVNNEAWVQADEAAKKRAVNNAEKVLLRIYGERRITDEAIFEQAIWLLKINESRRHAESGVTSYGVDGIQVSLSQIDRSLSPEVIALLGRRVGRSSSGRVGYINTNASHFRPPHGGV